MKLKAVILLIALGFIWGSGYTIARFAIIHGVTPLGYAFWQSWGPAVFLSVLYLWRNKRFPLSRHYLIFFLMTGALGIAIPNTNMYFSAAHLPAGILAVIVNTVPIVAYPLALFFQQERWSLMRLAGVGLGVLGLLFILLPKASLPSSDMTPWVILTLISPVSFALCAIYTAKYRPSKADSWALAAGMLIAAALMLTPVVLSTHQFFMFTSYMPKASLAVLLEIVLSSVGYILVFELLKVAGPVYYSLAGCLVSLTGLFWGWLIFNERMTVTIMLAVVFIIAAILLITLKKDAYVKSS